MFYNFYYLGSKVEEKLESIIESRQMKADEDLDHFAFFLPGDAESARINTSY